MRKRIPIALFSAALLAATVCADSLNWSLPSGASIDGGILSVDISADAPPGKRTIHCEAPLDLAGLVGPGKGIALSVRVRGRDVTKPAARWNGVKAMIRYVDETTGVTNWPRASLPVGTFGWTTATVRINDLLSPQTPAVGKATAVLGLEDCTGHAEFDLSTLSIVHEKVPTALVNQDWVVRYPAQHPTAQQRTPLRGFMLPQRPTTEDDIETLHNWGATLVRFQICRRFLAGIDDNQDLGEYAAWVDSRLDNLADVLRWAGERGMKVCVDLHVVPGGRRAGDREMNMFHDDRWADAFVDTWRRIATRCAPAVQTAGLYGYDLVNEPYQHGPAKNSYWEIQRRAAEAIREIDNVTPIIVESNMAASYHAFRYLSPLAMDNVIYQFHLYAPNPYTHQGVIGWPRTDNGAPLTWPGEYRGETWDKDYLRRTVAHVREFQLKHNARIYVGEFSAIAWAPGADRYLRDCIDLFAEYGWDWTYHAFREWPGWDVEKDGQDIKHMNPATDTPRKRVLLEGLQGE